MSKKRSKNNSKDQRRSKDTKWIRQGILLQV